jgi:hypothetical protein
MQPEPRKPFFDCQWDVTTIRALRALERGEASPEQQMGALQWVIDQAAATYEVSFHPGWPDATAFAEGRRFVGLQIVKLLNLGAPTKGVKNVRRNVVG